MDLEQLSLNKFFVDNSFYDNLKNGHQGAQKWSKESGKGCSRKLSQNKFFDLSTSSMIKGCDREKKRIVKIAVHYRCASKPPES